MKPTAARRRVYKGTPLSISPCSSPPFLPRALPSHSKVPWRAYLIFIAACLNNRISNLPVYDLHVQDRHRIILPLVPLSVRKRDRHTSGSKQDNTRSRLHRCITVQLLPQWHTNQLSGTMICRFLRLWARNKGSSH